MISKAYSGRYHDMNILKQSKILKSIPQDVSICVDLGFIGINKLCKNNILIGIKNKPKNN